MTKPAWYYSLQPGESDTWRSRPTGKLSISRLIESRPAFQTLLPGLVLKPKTLVVVTRSESLDPVAVKRKLVELMQQGHTVYLQHIEDTLRPQVTLLTDEWIENGSIDWQQVGASSRNTKEPFTLPEALHSQYLAGDLLLLKHYDLQCLLDEDFRPHTRIMHERDYRLGKDKDALNKLFEQPLIEKDRTKLEQEHTRSIDPELTSAIGSERSFTNTQVICEHFVPGRQWQIEPEGGQSHEFDYRPGFVSAIFYDEHITSLLAGEQITGIPVGFSPDSLEGIERLIYALPGYTLPEADKYFKLVGKVYGSCQFPQGHLDPNAEVSFVEMIFTDRSLSIPRDEKDSQKPIFAKAHGSADYMAARAVYLDALRAYEEDYAAYSAQLSAFNASKIRYLAAQGEEGPAESAVDELLHRCPNLRELSLGRVKKDANWPYMPRLKTLTIGYCLRLESLFALLRQCPALETLNIEMMELNSEADFPPLISLKKMNILRNIGRLQLYKDSNYQESFCDSVTLLPKLLAAVPNLEELQLDWEITLNVAQWPARLPQLKYVYSWELDKELPELMGRCPNLERLDFCSFAFDTLSIEREQRQEMFAQCPRLQHISVPSYVYHNVILWFQAALDFAPELSDETRQAIEKALKTARDNDIAAAKEREARAQRLRPTRGLFDTLGDVLDFNRRSSRTMPLFNSGFSSSASSASTSHLPITQNESFDPQSMSSHQADSSDAAFQYQGGHKNLDQGMVIDQLSQYLTLQKERIPKNITWGICSALSHICASMSPQQWLDMLHRIRGWDGTRKTLTPRLYDLFETIRRAVQTYQFVSFFSIVKRLVKGHLGKTWLGEGVLDWLRLQTEPCILANPWHGICVQILPATRGQAEPEYFAYNPSFIEGGVRVTHRDMPVFLQQSFGDLNLVSVEGAHRVNDPHINGADFLACGGLLTMYVASNSDAMLNELNKPEQQYDAKSLQGLFLRTTDGIPAWYGAFKSADRDLQSFALKRVADYMLLNPLSWWIKLEQSLDAVKKNARHGIINDLKKLANKHRAHLSPAHQACLDELSDLQTALKNEQADRDALQPLHVQVNQPADHDTYYQSIFNADKPSRLINLPDNASIQALRLALQAYGKGLGRPVIYIDSPDELTLSNPFVALQADGKTGVFSKGPGGRVFDQLCAGGNPPLIVVNFDNFPRAAMVRFNQLVDKNPNADDLALPPGSLVVALKNPNNPNAYHGSDLSSRFSIRESWPENLPLPVKLPIPTHPDSDDAYLLELFRSADWKERLLGYWAPRGDQLEWIEGDLQKALRSGKPITLGNAPRDSKGFEEFWLEARANGFILYEQQQIDLPDNFSLAFRQGYQWGAYAQSVLSWRDGIDPQAETLNAFTMSDFITRYECIADSKSVMAIDGLLKTTYAGQTLSLNISHHLSADQLASFISESTAAGVTLNLNLAPGVHLPQELIDLLPPQSHPLPPIEPVPGTRLIASSDPDETRASFGSEGVIPINVSECEPADLLNSIDGFFDKASCRLRFHDTHGLLPDLLNSDAHTLILKGNFSSELNQALTPYLLKRYAGAADKNLIILPDPNELGTDLSRFLPCDRLDVSADDKAALLDIPLNTQDLNTEPLCKLRARVRYLKKEGVDANSDHAWRGLSSLPVSLPMEDFRPEHSKAITARINAERRRAVDETLAHSPFVVITGLTGVGKSTFVEIELEKDNHVHYGYEAVRAWAADRRPGRKILFPDESNLQGRSWTDFEGLMEDPPFIRINNEIIYVTKEHVVVFACNPVSYGDKRNMPALFEQHGNAVVFDPMPQEYIYETILKPLLRYQFDKTQAANIAHEFLRVYRFLCERSEYSVLISPRELITMANLTLAHQNEQDDPLDVARHYARAIARGLVPAKSLREFDAQFPGHDLQPSSAFLARMNQAAASSSSAPQSGRRPFLYTASRMPVATLLEDMLKLRERCYAERDTAPEDFLYGGLGGMIIEAEPGQGKSEMVKDILLARGYDNTDPGKPLMDIKASLNDEVKERRAIKALHAGAVSLMDEINSAPLREELGNAILMRKTLDNKRPDNPGLLMLGTQNSAAMGGRVKASNAVSRRCINVQLRNYPDAEMLEILQNAGLSRIRALLLIQIYNEERGKGVAVTFRDLLRRAEDILREENPDYQAQEAWEIPELLLDRTQEDAAAQAPIPEHLQRLHAAIDRLRKKGVDMQEEGDALGQHEGEKAVAFADQLRGTARVLQDDNTPETRQAFADVLHAGFAEMGTHRNVWYPFLYNVGRAFRAIAVYAVEVFMNGGFFQPNTRRQKMVGKIEDELNRLGPL